MQIQDYKMQALLIVALIVPIPQPVVAQSVHRAKAQMIVGQNIQVSKSFADLAHYENLAVGDPKDSRRLITCSMVFPNERTLSTFQFCYASFDSGNTWTPTLKLTEGRVNGDPTIAYGHPDNVYVVSLMSKDLDKPKDPDPDAPNEVAKTVGYSSNDGGRTWSESSRFQFIDRPFIAIDPPNSRDAG